jgi:hypothetical protein
MSVPRYDRDGRRIEDGPRFGPATRQHWESAEERADRLQPEESEHEEAMASIMGEVEVAKAGLDLGDTDALTLDEGEELLSRAVNASKLAAAKVVEDNPPDLAGRITAQHDRAFQGYFHGEDNTSSSTDDGELTGDPIIGTDAFGSTVYDGPDGPYVLTDSNEDDDYDDEEAA